MGVSYNTDGSVVVTGNADPTRTATYAGPKNSTTQRSLVDAFFASDPGVPPVYGTADYIMANLPTPASTAPPGVADSSVVGSDTSYARGFHTHASKVRKQRVTGVNAATYAWTYPSPFTAGVVPIVQGVVEDPANSTSDSYNVQVVGAPTATQVTMRIIRQTSGLFGLLLGAIGFNSTPGTVNLHLLALEP